MRKKKRGGKEKNKTRKSRRTTNLCVREQERRMKGGKGEE